MLSYPQESKDIHPAPAFIEMKLRPILSQLRASPKLSPAATYQSGRRQYRVRVFSLRKQGNSSPSYPTHALMLERQDRRRVDLSSAASRFRLTPREQQTLSFLMQGMTSKEIASQMGVSPHTVKAFLRLVMSKMQVSTRSGIVGKLAGLMS